MQWSKRNRESLAEILPVRSSHERSGEQGRGRACVSCSVGGIGTHDAKRQSLNCCVKHSITGPHAGLARPTQYAREQPIPGNAGRISQTDAWRKIAISRRCQGSGHSWIGGIKNAGGGARENQGLLAGYKGRDLVVLLVPRFDAVPTQAVVQREGAGHPPTVLPVQTHVLVAAIKGL